MDGNLSAPHVDSSQRWLVSHAAVATNGSSPPRALALQRFRAASANHMTQRTRHISTLTEKELDAWKSEMAAADAEIREYR